MAPSQTRPQARGAQSAGAAIRLITLAVILALAIAHLTACAQATKLWGAAEEQSTQVQVRRQQQQQQASSPITSLLRYSHGNSQRNSNLKSQRRDLGLLALKALLLGPLIGLTLKAALIRGLVWALLAYGSHLLFPALLSSLGLGTGLVGFARQLRPDYSRIAAAYLVNLVQTLPGQYNHIIAPIVESLRAIPEGHCRYRAVCETATQLIRNVRSMSSTLQRISATVYMNFGTDYSKAWLDGIVQNDCAAKYAQCATSPLSLVAARLAQTIK